MATVLGAPSHTRQEGGLCPHYTDEDTEAQATDPRFLPRHMVASEACAVTTGPLDPLGPPSLLTSTWLLPSGAWPLREPAVRPSILQEPLGLEAGLRLFPAP